ncbi:MAG TPA: hypothetical protein VG621_01850 [Candidatus Paceibacterota bacterium]|nr:hypothetical protein [Candidatus Paceibacterota bacterium]
MRFLKALTLTTALYGGAGWLYIAGNAVVHPWTLAMPLTHFLSWPREDTFGIVCYGVSALSLFVYLLIKGE